MDLRDDRDVSILGDEPEPAHEPDDNDVEPDAGAVSERGAPRAEGPPAA